MPSSQATMKRSSSVKVLALFDDTPLSPVPIVSSFLPTQATMKEKSVDRRVRGTLSPKSIPSGTTLPPVGVDGYLGPPITSPSLSSPKKTNKASSSARWNKTSSGTERFDSEQDAPSTSNKLVKSAEIRASLSAMTYDDHQEYIQRMMQSISGAAEFSKNVALSNGTSSLGSNEEWMDSWVPTSSSDSTFEPGTQPRLKQIDDESIDRSVRVKNEWKAFVDDNLEKQKQTSRSPWSSSKEEDTDKYLGPVQPNDRQQRPGLLGSRPPSGSSRNLTKNMSSGRSSTRDIYKEVGNRDRRESTSSSTSMKKAQSERNLMSLVEESESDHGSARDYNDRNRRPQSQSSTHMKRATSERNLMSLAQDSGCDGPRDRNPRDYDHQRRSLSPTKRPQSERNSVSSTIESNRDRDRTRDYSHRNWRQSESSTAQSVRDWMSMSEHDDRDRSRDRHPRDYDHQSASSSAMKRPRSERNLASWNEESDYDHTSDDWYLERPYESKSRTESISRSRTRDTDQQYRRYRSSSSAFKETGQTERNSTTFSHDRDRCNRRDKDERRRSSVSTSRHKGAPSDRNSISLFEREERDHSRYREDKYDQSRSTYDNSNKNRTTSDDRDRRSRSNIYKTDRNSNMLSTRSDHRDYRSSRTGEYLSFSSERRRSSRSPLSSRHRSRSRNSRHRGSSYHDERRRDDYSDKDRLKNVATEPERYSQRAASEWKQGSKSRVPDSSHVSRLSKSLSRSSSVDRRNRQSTTLSIAAGEWQQRSPSRVLDSSPLSGSRKSLSRSSSVDRRNRQSTSLSHLSDERQQRSPSRVPDTSPLSRSRKSPNRRSSSAEHRHRHSTLLLSPGHKSSTLSNRSSMPIEFPLTHIDIALDDVDQPACLEDYPKSPLSIDSRGKHRSRRSSRHRSSSSNDSASESRRRRSSKSPRSHSSDRKVGRNSKDWKALRDMASSSTISRDSTSTAELSPLQVASWHGTSKSRPRRAGRKSELLASSLHFVALPGAEKNDDDDDDDPSRDELKKEKKEKKEKRRSSKSQERGKASKSERRRSNSNGSISRGPSRRRQREMDKAIFVLQTWARRLISRNQRQRWGGEAAVVIQEVASPFELFISRLKNDSTYFEMASKAVLHIQQLIRGYQAKVELHRLREEKVCHEKYASIHIQRIVRGHLAKLTVERARLKRKHELEQALAMFKPEKAKYIEHLMEKQKIQSELARDISICESKIQQVEDQYSAERKKLEATKEIQQRIWSEVIRKRVEIEQAKKEAERLAKEQEELSNLTNLDAAKEIAELEEEIAAMKIWLQSTEAKVATKRAEKNELERANVEVEKMFHELNEFAKGKVAENKELSSQQLMLTKMLLPKAVKNAETATQEIHKEIRSRLQLRRTIYRVFEEVKARNGHDQSLCDEVEVTIRQCEQELSQDLLEGNRVLELLIGDMDALFEIEVLRLHELGACPHVPASATGWDTIANGVLATMGKKKTTDGIRLG